jgi:tetratricopeptide (TPR) repeat protein/transcriptional regulator with XRE-family HTH domain
MNCVMFYTARTRKVNVDEHLLTPHRLKHERQRRGWSQADVASKIGSDTKTVGRWEQGIRFPSPYFQQRLIELFGKSAEELGLLSEHRDAEPLADQQEPSFGKASYRGIKGLPPPTHHSSIEQREHVIQAIYSRLIYPDTSSLVLTGIGGIGKSTLAALVHHYAEVQRHAGNGPFTAAPIWLTIDESTTMADLAGTLFDAFGKPSPDLSSLAPQNQAVALFLLLNATTDPRLVILDQFENVLDWRTGQVLANRPGIGEWLDALNSQPCRCRILLTSRPWPRGTGEYPPTHLQEYPVIGLDVAEGIELLRKQGVEARQATDEELRMAVTHCEGHALSLMLLASLLRHNRGLSLPLLLKDPVYAQLWHGDIARNLLDYIYARQLQEAERKLLEAFSVYRKPVPLEAALSLLDPLSETDRKQILKTLNVLLAQHLLQASEEALYQSHTIVTDYVREHVAEGDKKILRQIHTRAAAYFLRLAGDSCPPRQLRQGIGDVQPFIEAFWHLCQAERWQEAYSLIAQEGLYVELRRWGANTVLLELYQLLLPLDRWHPAPSQEAEIYSNLGRIYGTLGKKDLALRYYQQALHISMEIGDRLREAGTLNRLGTIHAHLGQYEQARERHERALNISTEIKDRKGEGDSLNSLAWICQNLGQKEAALAYYQQALDVHRNAGYRTGEADALNNMGLIYSALGRRESALECIEQALSLHKEAGDRAGESRALNHLGIIYTDLGQAEKAHAYYKQSLGIRREIGDRSGEGITLYNLGKLYLKQCHYEAALACLLLAKRIFQEVQSTNLHSTQKWLDTLQETLGEERFLSLVTCVEPQAFQVVEQAL